MNLKGLAVVRVCDSVWPMPSKAGSDNQKKLMSSLNEAVEEGDWSREADVALEEARRIFDAESERRSSADSKAGLYLAVITALIPVLTSLLPNLWGSEIHVVLGSLSLLMFGISVAYLIGAGWWAFKTIKVAISYTISPYDIAMSWRTDNPQQELAKRLSKAVIGNYDRVNEKVLFIKMTHAYLLRSFFGFVALLLIQASWPVAASIVDVLFDYFKPNGKFHSLIMCLS